jgi:hypothetical protein
MAALTFLYSFVFCYIRSQLKQFKKETSTAENESEPGDPTRWQPDLESNAMQYPLQSPALPSREQERRQKDPLLTPGIEAPPPLTSRRTTLKSISTVAPTKESSPVVHHQRQNSAQTFLTHHTFHTSATQDTSYIRTAITINSRDTLNSQLLARRRMLQVARSLLWYPLVYLCITTPLTIGRLATFANDSWAEVAIFVGAALYSCGGFCNVLLYTTTRKGIVNWRWRGFKLGHKDNDDEQVKTPKLPLDGRNYEEREKAERKSRSTSSGHGSGPSQTNTSVDATPAAYDFGKEGDDDGDELGEATEKDYDEENDDLRRHRSGCPGNAERDCNCNRRNTWI